LQLRYYYWKRTGSAMSPSGPLHFPLWHQLRITHFARMRHDSTPLFSIGSEHFAQMCPSGIAASLLESSDSTRLASMTGGYGKNERSFYPGNRKDASPERPTGAEGPLLDHVSTIPRKVQRKK